MIKKLVTFLLLGFAAAFISCGDEKTDPENQWFLTPQAAVSGTTVEMSCLTRFGDGVLENTPAGFLYAAVNNGSIGDFADAPGTVSGSRIASVLTGLSPETTYIAYAYADLPTGRVQSAAMAFETGTADIPDPDPDKPAFGTPSASAVTETTAVLTCGFTFKDAADYTVYFRYKASPSSDYSRKDVPAGTGAKTASLTSLTPGTAYEFELCADWNGTTYRSAAGSFTTDKGGVPPSGLTKYSGWPELPVEVGNSDYYYAYHICPNFSVNGHLARNFTVCYSAEHHCPVWVSGPLHDCYVGSSGNRNYGPDTVIPKNIQPSSKSIDSPYNKGHMLGNRERSRDAGMNKQVSFYTNMAPQHASTFNTGGGAWNNLEDYIDGLWCSDTLYMVAGCRFDAWTDSYGNIATPKRTGFGGVQASVPTLFYYALLRTKKGNSGKSVINCPADELQCVGFVMSHAMPKGHKPQRADMRSVEEIEEMAGFRFFTNVPNAPKGTYNPSDWGL